MKNPLPRVSPLLLFMALLCVTLPGRAEQINIAITKTTVGDWLVTYLSDAPVTQLTFVRNPDKSRQRRWTSLSPDMMIDYHEGSEIIRRRDRAPFDNASFILDASYHPLAKEYAPFSPFSDGGMLFHSGRFFVCADTCDDRHARWQMMVTAPVQDNIIVGGKIYNARVQWTDAANGQKIYVGPAAPVSDTHFISIIDSTLPPALHESIRTQLPLLVGFFAGHLGALNYRPALFASYHDRENGQYGNQGGTLPGQIFMHWYGYKSIHPFDSQATFWFFAHEVAHLFQREASQINAPEEAWVHEGAADLFAGLASDPAYLQTRVATAQADCARDTQGQTVYADAARARPSVHYSCGLLMMYQIDRAVRQHHDLTIFTLWQRFTEKVRRGQPASARSFLAVATPYLPAALNAALTRLTEKGIWDIADWRLENERL
ncbi:hypothetical protein [Alteromonas sp. CYL-A6]|uniref:hypothetical protein n=1 Tax=Alteromonas nitratireducens TaxID=3390813 RepID=UPI0034B168A8